MTEQQSKVGEFHEKFGLDVNDKPTLDIRPSVMRLREQLIHEEYKELCISTVCLASADKKQMLADIADALGDLLYVVLGAAVTYGIDLEPIFNEIHRSNMTKVWSDGLVHKDVNGKVVKPDTYSPADLRPIIEEQIKCQ